MTSFQDASPIGQLVTKRSTTARSIDLNQKLMTGGAGTWSCVPYGPASATFELGDHFFRRFRRRPDPSLPPHHRGAEGHARIYDSQGRTPHPATSISRAMARLSSPMPARWDSKVSCQSKRIRPTVRDARPTGSSRRTRRAKRCGEKKRKIGASRNGGDAEPLQAKSWPHL
jgi:hypothetical protein